jgi:hypothetical protein
MDGSLAVTVSSLLKHTINNHKSDLSIYIYNISLYYTFKRRQTSCTNCTNMLYIYFTSCTKNGFPDFHHYAGFLQCLSTYVTSIWQKFIIKIATSSYRVHTMKRRGSKILLSARILQNLHEVTFKILWGLRRRILKANALHMFRTSFLLQLSHIYIQSVSQAFIFTP